VLVLLLLLPLLELPLLVLPLLPPQPPPLVLHLVGLLGGVPTTRPQKPTLPPLLPPPQQQLLPRWMTPWRAFPSSLRMLTLRAL